MKRITVRHLMAADIDALMALEQEKWTDDQAAAPAEILARIEAFPELSIGAFCTLTGRALASLFLKPTDPERFTRPTDWSACARIDGPQAVPKGFADLFGISLSSRDGDATEAIFAFFLPRALKLGVTRIFLGSPVPGLKKAREKDPSLDLAAYVHARRDDGLPADPQLRYYHAKGFTKIVSAQADYFVHEKALDCAAIIAIDASALAPVMVLTKRMPLPWLIGLTRAGSAGWETGARLMAQLRRLPERLARSLGGPSGGGALQR